MLIARVHVSLAICVALSAIVAAAALAGCQRSGAGATTLRYHLSADPVSLDPALSEDGVSIKILHNLMDGLVAYDGSSKLVPRLARAWTVSPDGLRYEFELDPQARWSDGKPVTADDFVTALRRALTPATASKTAQLLTAIRGARASLAGQASMDQIAVSRNDAGRLVIELERPTPWFVHALTLTAAMPERADVLAANQGRWPDTAPSTGAYHLVSRERDRRMILERTRGAGPARVEVLIVQDETTAANLFEKGALDILTRVPSLDLERHRKSGALRTDPFVATWYIAFNVTKPPFVGREGREWRVAIAAAIRKDEVVRALGTDETAAASFIPPGLEGYASFVAPAVRKSGAQRLRGARLAPIAASFDTSSRNALIMEKIQSDVKLLTGLRLQLSNLDWKSYVGSLTSGAAPIYRFGWLAPFLDPISHLQVFTTGNPNNYSRWSNATYDSLVREIETLPSGAAREAKIREAQSLLIDQEAVVVPIFHYVQNHAVAKRIQGFQASRIGVTRFEELRISAE